MDKESHTKTKISKVALKQPIDTKLSEQSVSQVSFREDKKSAFNSSSRSKRSENQPQDDIKIKPYEFDESPRMSHHIPSSNTEGTCAIVNL